MPTKLKIEDFEPEKIEYAKNILDKYLRQVKRLHQKNKEDYLIQKEKRTFWQNLLHFFKR